MRYERTQLWHYGQQHMLGDWLLWSMYPLHFGSLWGPAGKLVWFVLGLSLAVLSVTGLLMYRNRLLPVFSVGPIR